MEAAIGLKPLKIGNLVAKHPVIQGGMGVGVSLSSLAGAVAKAGGIGIISTAQIGFKDQDFGKNPMAANLRAIHSELKKARDKAPQGILGFNIMVATKEYASYVKEAVKAGADVIISGAGLPIDMPKFVAEAEIENGGSEKKERRTMIAPIVSSVKSALVICRMWDRKYHTAPDFVVVEGPCAGGHLGFSGNQLTELGPNTDHVAGHLNETKTQWKIRRNHRDGGFAEVKHIDHHGGRYDIRIILLVGSFAEGVQNADEICDDEECDARMATKERHISTRKRKTL